MFIVRLSENTEQNDWFIGEDYQGYDISQKSNYILKGKSVL